MVLSPLSLIEFGESFHSHYGAKQESFFKFVEPTQLTTAAQKLVLRLLDICYGLGYNTVIIKQFQDLRFQGSESPDLP